MKAGRVIDGDEHDAKKLASQLVAEARKEADGLLAEARAEAERVTMKAQADATRLRDDAKVLAEQLVQSLRGETSPSITLPPDTASGHVDEVVGLVVRAKLPNVALGEIVKIDRSGFAGPRSDAERRG